MGDAYEISLHPRVFVIQDTDLILYLQTNEALTHHAAAGWLAQAHGRSC